MRLGSLDFRVSGMVNGLRYSPDGRFLFVLSSPEKTWGWEQERALHVLDAQGRLRIRSSIHLSFSDWFNDDAPFRGCVSPDGRLSAETGGRSEAGIITVRDLHTGMVIFRVKQLSQFAFVRFSPDSKFLAAVDQAAEDLKYINLGLPVSVRLWDVSNKRLAQTLMPPKGGKGEVLYRPRRFIFSPDGKYLATVGEEMGREGAIRIWEVAGKAQSWRLADHSETAGSIAFSPDSQILAEVSRGKLRFWNAGTGKQLQALADHADSCEALAFSPNGKSLVSMSDGNPRLWNLTAGTEILSQLNKVKAFSFSPRGDYLAILKNQAVSLLDVATGKERWQRPGSFFPLENRFLFQLLGQGLGQPVAFSPDGSLVLAANNHGPIRRWQADTGKEIPAPEGLDGVTEALAYAPDGRKLAVAGAGEVALWDLETGHRLHVLARFSMAKFFQEEYPRLPSCVSFSPDGKRVVVGWNDGKMSLWDRANGKLLWSASEHVSPVTALIFSWSDSRLLSSAQDGQVIGWDVETGRRQAEFVVPGAGETTDGLVLHPRARMAVSRSNQEADLWEMATRKHRRHLSAAADKMVFSPDARHLALVDSASIHLLDLMTGAVVRHFKTLGAPRNAAFSPGGRFLAATSDRGEVRVWEVDNGTLRREFEGHFFGSRALAFSPDGKTLATAGDNSGVVIWDSRFLGQSSTAARKPTMGGQSNNRPKLPAQVPLLHRTAPNEEPLPRQAEARLGVWRFQHGQQLSSLRFLPDGKTVLSGTADTKGFRAGIDSLWIWDVSTGTLSKQVRAELVAESQGSMSLNRGPSEFRIWPPRWCISPDGRNLAVIEGQVGFDDAGGFALRMIEIASGHTVWELQDFDEPFSYVQFSADGKTLAAIGGKEGMIRLLDTQTGNRIRTLRGDAKFIPLFCRFSPDGKYLVVHAKGQQQGTAVRIFNPNENGRFTSLPGIFSYVLAGFSPDSRVLMLGVPRKGSQPRLQLFGTDDGKFLHDIGENDSADPVFSPDGKLLAYSAYGRFRLWSVAAQKELFALSAGALFATFSPDGTRFAVGGNDTVDVFDTLTGKHQREWKRRAAKGTGIFLERGNARQGLGGSIAFSPDGNLLAATDGFAIRLFNVITGEAVESSGRQPVPGFLAFTRDGRKLAACTDQGIIIWDVAAGRQVQLLRVSDAQAPTSAWTRLSFSPDDRLLAAADAAGRIFAWNATDFRKQHAASKFSSPVRSFVMSKDGPELIAVCRNGQVVYWDWSKQEQSRSLQLVPFQPSRSASLDDTGGDANALAVSGDRAASVENGTIHLWDLATGRKTLTIVAANANGPATFSHSGRWLLSGDVPVLFDTLSGKEIRAFAGASRGAAFSPDDSLLATPGEDGIRVWETATGTAIGRLQGHRGKLTGLTFSPDGSRLASAGTDCVIYVWKVSALPSKTPRSVTPALWEKLADNDAAKAYMAMAALESNPHETLALLRHRLKPSRVDRKEQVKRLIADLASPSFKVREQATAELEKIGDPAETALRDALKGQTPLEFRRRVEKLLAKLADPLGSADNLRAWRALELLELITSPEAQELLDGLAHGAPGARLTRQAQAALNYIRTRSKAP